MRDGYGREIRYLRLSVTDRCNLRCRYCMPNGAALTTHEALLTYEELLRVCRCAVGLGITRFKVTGGEPLVRRGCVELIESLKALPGTEQVTLTTNGLLLAPLLPRLAALGLDGVNISLDTLDPAAYAALTGGAPGGAETALAAVEACVQSGLRTKINCVLLKENRGTLADVAALAARLPVDVRFIELMPIGAGGGLSGPAADAVLARLQSRWPDLAPVGEQRGNGPAHYYGSARLQGRIGFIDAVSHSFCQNCNRVRLTAEGLLKPCLCYGQGVDLRALLRDGASDEELTRALRTAVAQKPRAHCFAQPNEVTEHRWMSQIGG